MQADRGGWLLADWRTVEIGARLGMAQLLTLCDVIDVGYAYEQWQEGADKLPSIMG